MKMEFGGKPGEDDGVEVVEDPESSDATTSHGFMRESGRDLRLEIWRTEEMKPASTDGVGNGCFL